MRTAALGLILAAALVLMLIRFVTPQVTSILGALLAVASVPLLVVARVQLGKAFSIGPQARGLVKHGLYSRIRHPMYVFLDLTLLGVILAARKPVLLLPLAALSAVQAWQAAREEKVLERAFGEAYRRYKAGTWC